MQTGLSAWVLAIVRALGEAGVDHGPILREIGMDPDRVGDLNHRYFQEQVTSLWVAAVAATGNPGFGLEVARHVRPSTFHVVGYAMASSGTLRQAAERFSRSARLVSDSATVEFNDIGGAYELRVNLNTGGRPPIYQTIDTILGGFLMLCEWIQTTPIIPIQVTFRHELEGDAADYEKVFHRPVLFNQPHNSITFVADDLNQPVPSANEEMAMMLDELTSTYLALRFSSRFSRKVREALVSQLPLGRHGKDEIAQHLGMTGRTLLRRLGDENTSFQEVLETLRSEMSYDYLRQEDLTTEEIAERLGFSSGGTFSRAFMRWTGERPSDWRERQGKLRVVVPPPPSA